MRMGKEGTSWSTTHSPIHMGPPGHGSSVISFFSCFLLMGQGKTNSMVSRLIIILGFWHNTKPFSMLFSSLQLEFGLMSNHTAHHVASYTCFHLEGASTNHRTSTVTLGQLRLILAQAISNCHMHVTLHRDLPWKSASFRGHYHTIMIGIPSH